MSDDNGRMSDEEAMLFCAASEEIRSVLREHGLSASFVIASRSGWSIRFTHCAEWIPMTEEGTDVDFERFDKTSGPDQHKAALDTVEAMATMVEVIGDSEGHAQNLEERITDAFIAADLLAPEETPLYDPGREAFVIEDADADEESASTTEKPN